jgi:hypothetical protein
MLETVPNFSKVLQTHLHRTEWKDFPDVAILADESPIKKHPLYAAAKGGDVEAAQGLVLDTVTVAAIEKVCDVIGDSEPFLIPVHAVESEGRNPIPLVLAQMLSQTLNLPLDVNVIQINTVGHTGADGYTRLAFPALFDGKVQAGKYFLVDDFIGQGGTLTNLKGFLESGGGNVIGATALTGKAYSATLRLRENSLQELRAKHGNELEKWWTDTFGYGFERLNESEARYLIRADDAQSITERITAARRKRDNNVS